jgi:phage repressor protein C with HTH and peptisase S24 domain
LEAALIDLAVERGVLSNEVIRQPSKPVDFIDEVDVHAGMGGGGISIIENTTENGFQFASEAIRDHWRLPDYVLNRFNARPPHIKAFQADGDSMLPTIVGGDVVFADTRHRVPSPPGIYVLADQFGGVVVKRLEVISRPSEDPVQVRIISDNPRHSPQELTLDEINIIGKYVGRFTV